MIDVAKWKDESTKIAVPLTGTNFDQIKQELSDIKESIDKINLLEWRIDYLLDLSINSLLECNQLIRQVKLPLILTLRSETEGGNRIKGEYFDVLTNCLNQLTFDILDVEIDRDKNVDDLIDKAHQKGVAVIVSHHDLLHRLSKQTIIDKFKAMQEARADIAKIAIMPSDENDVLGLMQASLLAKQVLHIPIISMAMGEMGMISRLAPQQFGSNITFGALGKSSAPGQINVYDLKQFIDILKY